MHPTLRLFLHYSGITLGFYFVGFFFMLVSSIFFTAAPQSFVPTFTLMMQIFFAIIVFLAALVALKVWKKDKSFLAHSLFFSIIALILQPFFFILIGGSNDKFTFLFPSFLALLIAIAVVTFQNKRK